MKWLTSFYAAMINFVFLLTQNWKELDFDALVAQSALLFSLSSALGLFKALAMGSMQAWLAIAREIAAGEFDATIPLGERIAALAAVGVEYDEVSASHWCSRPHERAYPDSLLPLPLGWFDAISTAAPAPARERDNTPDASPAPRAAVRFNPPRPQQPCR